MVDAASPATEQEPHVSCGMEVSPQFTICRKPVLLGRAAT